MSKKSFREFYEDNEWGSTDEDLREKEQKLKSRRDQRRQKWQKDEDQ